MKWRVGPPNFAKALDYNKRLALVAAHTTDAVIVTDANGLIEWVNEGSSV